MTQFDNIAILAAGESSRFWPLSDKNLFNFSGDPLLLYQLKKIKKYGKKIFVVSNEKNFQSIKDALSLFNGQVSLVIQEGQGQAAAIASLKNKLKGSALFINCCDLFEEELLDRIEAKIRQTNPDALLCAVTTDRYIPGGYLKVKADLVEDVIEKPGQENKPSNLFRLVIDYFADAAQFIKCLNSARSTKDDLYEKALSDYIKLKKIVRFVEYKKNWTTLKYPWHVLTASKFFLEAIKPHQGKNVYIDKTAKIVGDVYLDDGVKIHEYSKIVGPCYIGKNVVIGNFALVVESMIGEKSVVGGYCEVTRSYLGQNVWLHRNYVGDSVLENNILFGAGTVLANFRFDGRDISSHIKENRVDTGFTKLGAIIGSNVKIGVNSTTMPGVKIGPNQKVMPHEMIKEDLR